MTPGHGTLTEVLEFRGQAPVHRVTVFPSGTLPSLQGSWLKSRPELEFVMMKPFAVAGLALMLASPVLAQSAAEKTGVNSVLGMAPKTQDFVAEAATSDMFEIA